MRALLGEIPRGLPDHRTADGVAYREYLRAVVENRGPFDRSARPTLRELGLTEVALQRKHRELRAVLAKKTPRRAEVRRLERQISKLRGQLVGLEEAIAIVQAWRRAMLCAEIEAELRDQLARSGLTWEDI